VNNKIAVVIPAGGSGTRFDKNKKKQFYTYKNKSLLWWSLQPFKSLDKRLYKIIIAIPDDLSDDEKSQLPKDKEITYCLGGPSRQESVMNALKVLKDNQFEGICIVHDAARPCLGVPQLNALIDKIDKTDEGAVLCVKVSDTIKKADDSLEVLQTVDRSQLWAAQTPQGGPFNKLYQANLDAISSGDKVTDDASILELAGIKVHIVEDSKKNLKITSSEDWDLFIYQN
jgi:2-C-methyl-D-erythritol 4-phosphate cytidylyltransferase